MPKTTDIQAIKGLAKTLIYVDFQLTPFSPVGIHHPYADSSLVCLKTDGRFQMIDLLEDKDGLKTWQAHLKGVIESEETAYDVYRYITKPYALSFIQMAEKYLSPEDLGTILRDAWTRIEFVSSNPVFTQAQFVKLFSKSDPASLMTADERKAFDTLPDNVEIYRGVRKGSKKAKGMSWTTDITVAEWFSKRFTEQHSRGDVYKALVNKSDILAYFQGSNERELVVDTSGLKKIEKMTEQAIHTESQKLSLSEIVEYAASRKKDAVPVPHLSHNEPCL